MTYLEFRTGMYSFGVFSTSDVKNLFADSINQAKLV